MGYISYLFTNAKVSFKYMLVYRGSVLIWLFSQILLQIGGYLSIGAYYSFGNHVAEVSQDWFLSYFACFQFVIVLYNILVEPSHDELPDQIFDGELDFILLKPMNALFLASTQRFGFDSIFALILPIAILKTHLPVSFSEMSVSTAVFVFLALLNALLVYSLFMSVAVLICFWSSQNVALWRTAELLLETGARPSKAYPKAFSFLFGNFVPIILVMNFPISIIGHQATFMTFFKGMILTLTLLLLNVILWKKGVKLYASAGG